MKDEKHPCEGCKYAYFTDVKDSVVFYNALASVYEDRTFLVRSPCCGHDPGGTTVDKDQPPCKAYEKEEDVVDLESYIAEKINEAIEKMGEE